MTPRKTNGTTATLDRPDLAPTLQAKIISETDELTTFTVKLPEPGFTRFALHLTGTNPLITDAFSEARKDKFARTQDGSAKPKPGPRDPEAEFHEAMYRLPDGSFGIPKLAFRKAFAAAATRMTEIKGVEVLAAFQIDTPDEYLKVECSEPTMRRDNVVRMGRANLAYRPEFREWAVWIPVKLDHEVVTLDQFIHIVNKAGLGVGVGNWRPEKKGDFGLWEVDEITEVTRTRGVQIPRKS